MKVMTIDTFVGQRNVRHRVLLHKWTEVLKFTEEANDFLENGSNGLDIRFLAHSRCIA